jgi:hypothetical protein
VSDTLRGDEARSTAALHKWSRTSIIFWAYTVCTPAVRGHAEEHVEASRKQGSGCRGGRNGRRARRSFAGLQVGVSARLFADAANDAGDAGKTCWYKHVF